MRVSTMAQHNLALNATPKKRKFVSIVFIISDDESAKAHSDRLRLLAGADLRLTYVGF